VIFKANENVAATAHKNVTDTTRAAAAGSRFDKAQSLHLEVPFDGEGLADDL
jgi:hypothetical protein